MTKTRSRLARFARLLGAALLVTGAVVAPAAAGTAAHAEVPGTPVAAPFDAPLCENTIGNPAVDADGGPVTNLLSVFGQRLTDYNDGKPVILYNNSGRSGWTSSGSQYSANPLCATRYVEEVGGPVSSWMYCTYDRASTCGWTNANGELERQGTVLPGLQYLDPDNRLTADEQKLQSYIIQNDIPVIAGPNGSGGTLASDTVANDDTPQSRSLRQNLVHCIDNPGRSSGLVFCENNMSAETQARILELIGSDPAAMLSATGPSTTVAPGAEGEVVVSTTLGGIPLDMTVTGGTATVCGGPATLTGGVLVVDEDAELPADITLCVTRADAGDVSVSVSGTPPVIENIGFFQSKRYEGDTLCQIFSAVEAERQTTLDARTTVTFGDAPAAEPSIGTSLVDALDGDRIIKWWGGAAIDTVTYENLTPGTEYTVTGELMFKYGGQDPTGITGSTTFTPTSPNGSVDVEFNIPPMTYAGTALVAFERLYVGADAVGTPIAVHEDFNDADQTVELGPWTTPSIGTSLVDSADNDRVLPWNGGTVVDTIAYRDLMPGTTYRVTGELMDKETGLSAGITAVVSFTPTAGDGTVDVTFDVPAGYAGKSLVAFEKVEWPEVPGSPNTVWFTAAVHEDIDDAAQTVTVEEAPVAADPVIGTSLVDSADGDRVLPWNGGTVIDTVAYQNLIPGVEYYIMGELMNKADGTGTGVTAEMPFTPTTANGSIEVTFTVPEGYSGETLVAFEQLWRFDLSVPVMVASHEDIDDAAQTVTVEEAPVAADPVIGTSLVDSADGDRVLPWNGGTVIDTVAYQNLTPGTEYTVTGELMNKADGSGTGITGSKTFTPTQANGSVEVAFVVPTGFAGEVLVAYEQLFEGTDTTGEPVATHEDINDAAQTVTVEKAAPQRPTDSNEGHLSSTGGSLPWIGAGAAVLLLTAGTALLLTRKRRVDHIEQ